MAWRLYGKGWIGRGEARHQGRGTAMAKGARPPPNRLGGDWHLSPVDGVERA